MQNPLPFGQQLRHERRLRGWSQAKLAEKVGIDTKTVRRWEQGESMPRLFYHQILCQLFGKNAQEFGLLAESNTRPFTESGLSSTTFAEGADSVSVDKMVMVQASFQNNTSSFQQHPVREDWGEAPSIPHIHGRTSECNTLLQWIGQENCRVIAITGMGGVGKTTLVATTAEQVHGSFEVLLWRSLHNAPPLKTLLQGCLRFFSPQQEHILSDNEEELIPQFVDYLRHHRCLLVFDNFESVMQPQQRAGSYQKIHTGYGRLLQRLVETKHRSCLLLTSRDKPREIAHAEGSLSPVRTLVLEGVNFKDGRALLQEKALVGTDAEWEELVRLYAGNPLALKIVAESIQDVFDGTLTGFLAEGAIAFGDLNDLLDQQFHRLSPQEQDVVYWLAIEREPVSLEIVRENLLQQTQRGELVETFASLRRRSLIESRGTGTFTLQPAIMEYVTTRLVKRMCDEMQVDNTSAWTRYALMKAQVKEYVRESQLRLLLHPVAQHFLDVFGRAGLKHHFDELLALQRELPSLQSSYLAGNILNVLVYLHYDLSSYDFSHLTIRQAYLQHVMLSDVNFTSTSFIDAVFTNTFGNILSVVFSPDGHLLAAGTATGDIWLYEPISGKQQACYSGHTDGVWRLAFSPDSQVLASSSDDQTIRLWNVKTGECLFVLNEHSNRIRALAFYPTGKTLVSGSDDSTVRMWDVETGHCSQVLSGHTGRVWAVAIHNDGNLLATGGTDQTIRLWDSGTGQHLTTMSGHTGSIRSLAFQPGGNLLASGSDDHTVRLWESHSDSAITTLRGHHNRVWTVAFDSTGTILASGSEDHTICLWDMASRQCRQTFSDHTNGVRAVAFAPSTANAWLASGGDDQTFRLWETTTGHCLRTFQGYTNRVWAVLFSPDGKQLLSCSENKVLRMWDSEKATCTRTIQVGEHRARSLAYSPDGQTFASGGEDQTVRLWNAVTGQQLVIFQGHNDWVGAVAFHPNGQVLASGSEDTTVRLWDITTGDCIHCMVGHSNWIRAVAFSYDGNTLASAGDDATIRVWDPHTGNCLHVLSGHAGRVRSLAFHPDGQLLVSGSEDHTIRCWHIATETCQFVLEGHTGRVRSVACSPDGQLLASGSEDHTIRLWNMSNQQCVAVLRGHTNRVRWVCFHPSGELLVSGGDNGAIKLWRLASGECIQTLLSERPYERMNISRVEGLTVSQKATLRLLGAIED